MSVDKLVDSTQLDADLTSVANAIRTKGGTSASLAFPAEFVQAIGDIPSGGGEDQISGLYDGTLTSVEVTSENLGRGVLSGYTPLTSFKAPNAWRLEGGRTLYNTRLTTLVLPKCKALNGNQPIGYISTLTAFDMGGSDTAGQSSFSNSAFQNNTNMSILVIRGNAVTACGGTGAFNSTPFASGGSGGTLYVPASLISSYQSATNWSTILGYTNNQIKSIESTHTDPNAPIDLTLYYADGTLIPT